MLEAMAVGTEHEEVVESPAAPPGPVGTETRRCNGVGKWRSKGASTPQIAQDVATIAGRVTRNVPNRRLTPEPDSTGLPPR
jgi:hypothetical protein